ncbi:MAG: PIN domain-containing protein [Acidobacteria bacterium]|nr:PIN domain-containing protein [Acidobacteriota bacterium]
MIAYLDSSVLLRVILGQRDKLKEWKSIDRGVASALVETECLRSLDRLRLRSGTGDEEIAIRREAVFRLLESIEVVDLDQRILKRAAQPLPTELGTLDAIHLVTALDWGEESGKPLVMATHDQALGVAARACGLPVVGLI